MPQRYTIGQLARAAEVPTSTVRFYERAGLLAPIDRSEGNYRLYTDASLRRLRFIRAAQATGFTLEDVKTLLGSREGNPPSCDEVQALIQQRLAEIDKRLRELRHVQQVLKVSLQKCKRIAQRGCCHVLETLHRSSS
jgi:MerR family mercuric resistance operon transcriptional regulator